MPPILKKIDSISKSVRTMEVIFWGMIFARFIAPIIDNPKDHLFSDPGRHWINGDKLLNPEMMSSIDPKLYQLVIFIIRKLSFGYDTPVGVMCGLMSAGMAYFWYRTCREIYKKESALFLAFVIGICPSLLFIFQYFMNETILLFMLSLSLWLTLRAVRKKTAGAFITATCILILSLYTRIIMFPIAIAAIWLMIYYVKPRIKNFIAPVLLFITCTGLAGWHSYNGLYVFAPFGFKEMNQFYAYSNSRTFEIHTPRGHLGFSSPIFYYKIGSPLFEYNSYREKRVAIAYVTPQKGISEWDREIAKAKEIYTLESMLYHLQDNFIFLSFGNSWPDSGESKEDPAHLQIAFHSRWMWFPMIMILVLATPFTRATRPEIFILCCSGGLLLLMLTQQMGVMEGRYRKPLEPLLIISMYALIRNKTLPTVSLMPQLVSPKDFLWEIYLRPVYAFIIQKKAQANRIFTR